MTSLNDFLKSVEEYRDHTSEMIGTDCGDEYTYGEHAALSWVIEKIKDIG